MIILSQKNSSFVNVDVIWCLFRACFAGGLFIYLYIIYHPLILLLLAICWILYPPRYKYLYYRWILFGYNRSTTLSIDTDRSIFRYQRENEIVTFESQDVQRWCWMKYGTYFNTLVEVIEFELKNGRKVIISSGIGQGDSADLSDFFLFYRKELGLPDGEHNFKFDLHSYIKEIAE